MILYKIEQIADTHKHRLIKVYPVHTGTKHKKNGSPCVLTSIILYEIMI